MLRCGQWPGNHLIEGKRGDGEEMERNYELKFIKQVDYENTCDVGDGQDILME